MYLLYPETNHSIWLIHQSHLQRALQASQCTKAFEERYIHLLAPLTASPVVFTDTPYVFAMYFDRSCERDGNDVPVHIAELIPRMVSVMQLQEESATAFSIWNVCNDLTIRHGYMRRLFDVVIDKTFAEPQIQELSLYVAFANTLYGDRAVRLYAEKGFVITGTYRGIAVTMKRYRHPETTAIESVMQEWNRMKNDV